MDSLSGLVIGFAIGFAGGVYLTRLYYLNLKALPKESLTQEQMDMLQLIDHVQEETLRLYTWAQRLPKRPKEDKK